MLFACACGIINVVWLDYEGRLDEDEGPHPATEGSPDQKYSSKWSRYLSFMKRTDNKLHAPANISKKAGAARLSVDRIKWVAKKGVPPPKMAMLTLCAKESPENRTCVGMISTNAVGMVPKKMPIKNAKIPWQTSNVW